MADIKIPHLLAAAEEFNVGINIIVKFLEQKGINRESLKAKKRLSQEMYDLVKSEFGSQNIKKKETDLSEIPIPPIIESTLQEPPPVIESIQAQKLTGPKILGKITLPIDSDSNPQRTYSRGRNMPIRRSIQERKNINSKNNTRSDNKDLKDNLIKNENKQAVYQVRNKKLGKVKFYDDTKGFGYVLSYDDARECFISVSNIITSGIKKDDIVIFETIVSKKKPGELDAVKVSNKIPVIIFNKESATNSYAYPLLENHLKHEIALTEKLQNCFAVIEANYYEISWRVLVFSKNSIEKAIESKFAKIIISKFLHNLTEYKKSINWLTELLQIELKKDEFEAIYRDTINNLQQKSIPELSKEIRNIKDVSFLSSFFELSNKTLNKFSFVLWCQSELDKLPYSSSQDDVDLWRSEVLPSLGWKTLQQVLTNLLAEQGATTLVEESYRFLIEEGWEINTREEFEIITAFLSSFQSVFPLISVEESNFTCKDNQFYIDLFDKGLIINISEARLKQYIDVLPDEGKVKFIEKLPASEVLLYYSAYPALSSYQEKYIAGLLENEFSGLNYICFDLESNGEEIYEYAWKTKLDFKTDALFENTNEGISHLIYLLNSSELIIGQNIKEFDLPILAKHGASPSSGLIWDTLEIEMLLNPTRFSFGLSAQHSASSDTELTFKLFKNQLSRIIVSKDNATVVKEFLPPKAIELINQITSNSSLASLNYDFLVKESNRFYRSNPTNQNIPHQAANKLSEKLKERGSKVIIAPEFLWNTLSHHFELTFHSDAKLFGLCLNKEKIESTFSNEKFLKSILSNFVDICFLKSTRPYFDHLPIAIKLKITKEQAILICDNINADFKQADNRTICIKPADINVLKEKHGNVISNLKVIVVGNELYNLTSKLQLGQDLDFATIFDRLKDEPIWLQMSGGKSFISLEKKHCKQLGIIEFPEFVRNIWLEKVGKGKFKVWCNIHFEACINNLSVDEVCYIDWVEESFIKDSSFIVRPDARKSGYIAEQKRVNPESLNRKIYWVYQFKLLAGLYTKSDNPKVLIVNDDSEFDKITGYARKLGFFIPDAKASLARQLELLHTHNSPNRLLVTSFQNLEKVISNNHIGAIDFIWDSFLLQEKLQMLKGLLSPDLENLDAQKEDDFQTTINSVHKDYDIFSLIKLHKSLIDYYYKMLEDNNQDSQLFLCDARLTDYYGIENSLNLRVMSVPLWYKESDYNTDVEIAAKFFSREETVDTNFNIEEAKEILRKIFLTPTEGGDAYHWHDYQHPCLNEILPAKKDLLISLPTGAGKSLLFQGPALFRSAFSCKLSIVISPLRALMQDQVDALWNKGFYSNVEFLSGDKSHVEIRDIYRRVAGGEITLLYITPERFRSRTFENCLLTRLDADSGLEYIVFDEAHCISQWGQEFRPDYLNAGKKVAGYSETFELRKLLFSATISEQVFEEITKLMPGVVTVEGAEKSYNPVRDHIKMDFKLNVVDDDRLLEISNYLKSGKFNPSLSRAIIFVKSRKKVEECALIMPDNLKEVFGANCNFCGKVGAFHAGMDAEDRKETYEKYKNGEIVILFATKAFGMGMDIPNIHFVTHYSPPSTFEDFLQEVGRAGRNEKLRLEAGFNNIKNPIKTLCLTANNDFPKLKDQLHESRISWHEIKEIKLILEDYIARFKPLSPDNELPVAVPFNLYSNEIGTTNDDLDNKFRIALHWLERLERIKIGYFTITHLEFDSASLFKLQERIHKCPDKDCGAVCRAIIELLPNNTSSGKVIQLSIAYLRSISKLSLENLFTALLKNHTAGILKLLQTVVIEPTKARTDETNYCRNIFQEKEKYPAIQVVFALAKKILQHVPLNDSKFFEGDELDNWMNEAISDNINFSNLPWTKKENPESKTKEYQAYKNDILKKRSKHAFTIIRLLGKTKHETKMEKVSDSNRKVVVKQSVFNGYHKEEEWLNKINQLKKDCVELLDLVSKQYFDKNVKKFNWPDIVAELDFKGNVQYISDLLFILSVLGYTLSGGLLPTGIEIYLSSIASIDEMENDSNEQRIYKEFLETQEIRELKLISLQVLSELKTEEQDTFIKGFFAAKSKRELINHLEGKIDSEHTIFRAFRGDAIKYLETNKLNEEQKKIYLADPNQNINVMAGPGSGKTHTLTLRVARLVHHFHINPEEILVLAYNRAVVSELKERLGNLFKDLGYGNLAKRIKIFTFHGLAKKYCGDQLRDLEFKDWEPKLLEILSETPGIIMNQLAPLRHILVDEFQDINEVRMDLLYRINELTGANLFIIGDPNQSIYGYDRSEMDPFYYYDDFDDKFNPTKFTLLDNHRSYPAILNLASQILTLREEHQHLIPRPTRFPDKNFKANYAQIIDNVQNPEIKWWTLIGDLLKEKVKGANDREARPYKQIAILFRTNNEVYRGFQKVKGLELPNIRIRIQGSLPYEFTRIRECHAVILFLKSKIGQIIPLDFKQTFRAFINDLISQNQNWSHFYIRVIHALVLEYLDEQDEGQIFDNLLEFIIELTYKDDGQLYKIYEKHIEEIVSTIHETEIVLTTMHKVKGLEFDSVIIPPSFSNLPLKINDELTEGELSEQLDEEKRLAFVSYTRARYRLVVFKHLREIALTNNNSYTVPENANIQLGIPVHPEINKLNIGWAAGNYIFNSGVNNYIKSQIKSGDFVYVKKRDVPNNDNPFSVHELFKEGSNRAIGQLSRDAGKVLQHSFCGGFVVNEVVIWSYEDTVRFDQENPGKNYSLSWCDGSRNQGYIYLVDFAGFGVPGNL